MPHNRVFLRMSTRSGDDVSAPPWRASTFNLLSISEIIDEKGVLRIRMNNGRSHIIAPESGKVFRDAIEGMMIGVELGSLFEADPVQDMIDGNIKLHETIEQNHKALTESYERKRNSKKEGLDEENI